MSESNRRRGPHLIAALTGLVGDSVLESLLHTKKLDFVEQNVNDKSAQKSKAEEKRLRKQQRNIRNITTHMMNSSKTITLTEEEIMRSHVVQEEKRRPIVIYDEAAQLTDKDLARLKDVIMPKEEGE